ncbi:MAG: hypothetical protein AB7V18_02330 [Pyrinomonadaceae bacterium]
MEIKFDKIGSATRWDRVPGKASIISERTVTRVGDLIAVRAVSESVVYGNLELPSGRLAKINLGDVLAGVLGKRRALKGFVGDVPAKVQASDRLHLLNMGGVVGECVGHHSSLSDAIELEVLGIVCDETGLPMNIGDRALPRSERLEIDVLVIFVAGSCMNSGKTVAAIELVKQATRAGLRVAAAKLTGVACLRDTLNMEDHGAFATASFLDCGLPSTVDVADLSAVAKGLLNYLAALGPDLIVAELGDGIVGGYGVDSVLRDPEIRSTAQAFVFCASDYVGVAGGINILGDMDIAIDVVAGSVTDSQMGEEFITRNFGLAAGNARRDGKRLFELAMRSIRSEAAFA